MGEAEREPLQLEVHHGDLHDTSVGRGVRQVDGGPAARRGHEHHPGVGVDDERVADSTEQRRVVDAVAVRVARRQVDPVAVGPLAHGGELAGAPDERPGDRAVVGAVGVDAVAGGHHVVEPEQLCQRGHQVVRGGGGEHDRPAGGTVLVEQRGGERLDHLAEVHRGVTRRRLDRLAAAPLGEHRGLAGQRHRRQGLADGVEQLVQQRFPGDRPGHEPCGAHRVREHLARGTGEQRSVEVEEGGAAPRGRGGGRRGGR